MTLAGWLLLAGLCLGFAYWLFTGMLGLVAMWTMPVLAAQKPPDPSRWPALSVVIPACNEAPSIEAAVTSRLAQDYPDFEVCVVDDRSTDGTGEIVDRLAQGDRRVRPLHITALPDGWLGKVHALHQGVTIATGEWLLLTDADVHFAPSTLRRAVAYSEARGLDFLTVIPTIWRRGILLDASISHFLRTIAGAALPSKIEDPRSRAAVGGGVFNLVRRSAYERSPGLPWLRMEIADDVTFGQMMKRAGARCSVVNGRGMVELAFYETLGEMMRGTEKAGFSLLGRFSYVRLFVFVVLMLFFDLSPWIALLPVGPSAVRIAGAIMVAFAVASAGLVNRLSGRAMWPSLLLPIASVVSAVFMLRSGYLVRRRGGLVWRGTIYPIETLKAGVRFVPPWRRIRPLEGKAQSE